MYIVFEKRKEEVIKGRSKEIWENYFKCWCDSKNLYTKELIGLLELKIENVIKLETRFCNKLKDLNTKDYRIKKDNKIYDLINVDYGKEVGSKIILKAKEVL